MTGVRLADQVWIVTGAASGIGRAIARLFASEGARMVVADVTQQVIEGGMPTVDVIAAEGGKAIYLPTDVSQREQVDATVADTVSRTAASTASSTMPAFVMQDRCSRWTRAIGNAFSRSI